MRPRTTGSSHPRNQASDTGQGIACWLLPELFSGFSGGGSRASRAYGGGRRPRRRGTRRLGRRRRRDSGPSPLSGPQPDASGRCLGLQGQHTEDLPKARQHRHGDDRADDACELDADDDGKQPGNRVEARGAANEVGHEKPPLKEVRARDPAYVSERLVDGYDDRDTDDRCLSLVRVTRAGGPGAGRRGGLRGR
jgi:hypothetical protein